METPRPPPQDAHRSRLALSQQLRDPATLPSPRGSRTIPLGAPPPSWPPRLTTASPASSDTGTALPSPRMDPALDLRFACSTAHKPPRPNPNTCPPPRPTLPNTFLHSADGVRFCRCPCTSALWLTPSSSPQPRGHCWDPPYGSCRPTAQRSIPAGPRKPLPPRPSATERKAGFTRPSSPQWPPLRRPSMLATPGVPGLLPRAPAAPVRGRHRGRVSS